MQCSVDPQKAIGFNMTMSGNNNVGTNKVVVFNGTVMANMITAPQRHIISNLHKWLNGVVFEDKAIVSGFKL